MDGSAVMHVKEHAEGQVLLKGLCTAVVPGSRGVGGGRGGKLCKVGDGSAKLRGREHAEGPVIFKGLCTGGVPGTRAKDLGGWVGWVTQLGWERKSAKID